MSLENQTRHEPEISLEQAKELVATKTHPRVTEESIKSKIDHVKYYNPVGSLTICVITMRNGFHVVGISAPADKRNFDPQVGERYAYENAFKQLWQLEGYLLRDKLSRSVE